MNDQHNIDILSEIMEENGVIASREQIKEIGETFMDHLVNMSDMRYERHAQAASSKSTCSNCERLEADLKRMQPVSACCHRDMYWNRTHWVCQSCGKSTIRTVK